VHLLANVFDCTTAGDHKRNESAEKMVTEEMKNIYIQHNLTSLYVQVLIGL
jgi:hypothetical protein